MTLLAFLGLGKTEEAGKAGADAEVIGSAELDSRRAFAEDHYRDRHPNVLLWGAGKVRPTLIVRRVLGFCALCPAFWHAVLLLAVRSGGLVAVPCG